MSGKQTQSIDISQLNVTQLNSLSQQLDQEMEFFTSSLSQLKMLQGKFTESQDCVSRVQGDMVGKDVLVPLTGAMYVNGQLSDTDNVLIDVGTGYFVEMTTDAAKDYFKRKVEYLTKQIEKLQPVLQEKYNMKQVVMEVLQMKVQSQIALQQQHAAKSS